ncbi:MAG TPA: hypothetical protein VJ044_13840 [Candidatus Hodarchaeales archaeon]|nr:hypothetical protein [Candidatus Hodarchaeales archaeon]
MAIALVDYIATRVLRILLLGPVKRSLTAVMGYAHQQYTKIVTLAAIVDVLGIHIVPVLRQLA